LAGHAPPNPDKSAKQIQPRRPPLRRGFIFSRESEPRLPTVISEPGLWPPRQRPKLAATAPQSVMTCGLKVSERIPLLSEIVRTPARSARAQRPVTRPMSSRKDALFFLRSSHSARNHVLTLDQSASCAPIGDTIDIGIPHCAHSGARSGSRRN
jgi:hypothetical protein